MSSLVVGVVAVAIRTTAILRIVVYCRQNSPVSSRKAQQTGISKTEVAVGALAHYLGCIENLPLNQRVTELEVRTTVLEALVKASSIKNNFNN